MQAHPTRSSAPDVRRRRVVQASGLLLATAGVPGFVTAQDKPLATLLLPFPPGGAGDLLARTLADKLKTELGRNVVVDNRPGGATRIAGEALKNGPADGSMVLLSPIDPMFIVPAIFPATRYDPRNEFKPITDVAALQFGIAVPADSPYKTLPQYLQAARAKRGQGDIGISLVGSLLHFLAILTVSIKSSYYTRIFIHCVRCWQWAQAIDLISTWSTWRKDWGTQTVIRV